MLVLTARIGNANSLRYFPEISGKNLHSFSVANSDYVVASGNGDLYYWDGNSWHFFDPPFPKTKTQITFVKAFSPNNVWTFFREKENVFYTRCLHYNKGNWREVYMPQLNDLEHFSFLDSSRFYAAGHWGSLIYYDGKKARNIKNRSGVCFSFLQAFSPNLFFAAYRPYESKSFVEMYRVQNGKWEKLFDLDNDIGAAWFYNPDSAIVFEGAGSGPRGSYIYYNGNLKKVDSLPEDDGITQNGSHFYFYIDNKVWLFRPGSSTAFFSAPGPLMLVPLKDNEFFLRTNNGRIFYWGRKKTGMSVQSPARLFFKPYPIGPEGGGFEGLALFRNQQQNIEIYFTAITDNNMFINFPDTNNVDANKDVLLQRNLLGFGKEERPLVAWDAGIFLPIWIMMAIKTLF